jgi:hypothetical protein
MLMSEESVKNEQVRAYENSRLYAAEVPLLADVLPSYYEPPAYAKPTHTTKLTAHADNYYKYNTGTL